MITSHEARRRGLVQATAYLPDRSRILSRWGLLSAREWVVRESLRLSVLWRVEPVYHGRSVAIWIERGAQTTTFPAGHPEVHSPLYRPPETDDG